MGPLKSTGEVVRDVESDGINLYMGLMELERRLAITELLFRKNVDSCIYACVDTAQSLGRGPLRQDSRFSPMTIINARSPNSNHRVAKFNAK